MLGPGSSEPWGQICEDRVLPVIGRDTVRVGSRTDLPLWLSSIDHGGTPVIPEVFASIVPLMLVMLIPRLAN